MMKSSLRIGWLVLRGCLAAATASLILPQSFAAAQSTTQNVSVSNKLFRSVQANDLAGVQSAISEGADIQARDRWGMTPTDIAIDRGYYRIAHFLAASRNHSHDQNAASAAPSVPAKSAPLGISDARGNAPARNARNNSARVDSLGASDQTDTLVESSADEANPFDQAAPAPGSQLRSIQGR